MTVEQHPFPHLIIDNFLSKRDLGSLNKAITNYQDYRNTSDNHSYIDIVNLSKSSIIHKMISKYFTENFRDALLAQFYDNIYRLFNKLSVPIGALQFQDWSDTGTIDWRHPGNELPVHIDWPNRILSVILYLDPYKDSDHSMGTKLYEIESDGLDVHTELSRITNVGKNRIAEDRYKQIPFVENRLIAFMNSHISYHSATVSKNITTKGRIVLVKGINLSRTCTSKYFTLPKELQ